jgi:hypothetical protein
MFGLLLLLTATRLAEASSGEPRETSCLRENRVSLPKWAR